MTMTDAKAAKRQERIDAATTRLADAVEQITSGDDWKRALTFMSSFHRYSFGNVLLINLQHAERFEQGTVETPAPRLVAGFQRWKDHGRSVTAGQKGYAILAPAMMKVRTATLPGGKVVRLGKDEAAPAGATEQSKKIPRGFTVTYVWDVAQTSGEEIPERPMPKLLDGDAPADLYNDLAKIVAEHGFGLGDVDTAAAIGGANGVTNFADREILIRADVSPMQRVKTLVHEIAHMLLHDPAGDSAEWVTGSRVHRGRAEVEAESVAFVTLSALGVDTDDYSFPYVSGWATAADGTTPVDVVKQTGQRVQKAAAAILDKLPIETVGGKMPEATED
jgi:hypothetical protein